MDKNFNFKQPFIVVGGLLEKGGKYLLVKESGGPDKGKWNIPAGILDMGENPVEGAAREIREETGFDFEATNILGIYAGHKVNGGTYAIKIIVAGEFGEEQSELYDDISETKWFSKDEILAMGPETLRTVDIKDMFEDYEAGIRYPLDLIKKEDYKINGKDYFDKSIKKL